MAPPHKVLTTGHPPQLPLEVHHHILRYCDPSTLARTSAVSLAFLELSSQLLYTHVNLPSTRQARQLTHKQLAPSSLSPYFSLTQMRTLRIHEDDSSTEDTEKPSFKGGPPLQLDRVWVTLRPVCKLLPCIDSILATVAPRVLDIIAEVGFPGAVVLEDRYNLPLLSLDPLPCERLQTLHLTNAGVDTSLRDLAVSNLRLVIRATAELDPASWDDLVSTFAADLAMPNRLEDNGAGDFACRGMTVQIWVDTEERKQDLLDSVSEWLNSNWAVFPSDATTRQNRLARIHVDVETQGRLLIFEDATR